MKSFRQQGLAILDKVYDFSLPYYSEFKSISQEKRELLEGALGLHEEAREMMEATTEEELVSETGDFMYFLAMLTHALGLKNKELPSTQGVSVDTSRVLRCANKVAIKDREDLRDEFILAVTAFLPRDKASVELFKKGFEALRKKIRARYPSGIYTVQDAIERKDEKGDSHGV